MKYAVLDTETTGLYNSDRVIEIAILVLDDRGQVLDEWDTLLDPGRDVGPVDIHGVTATMVASAPTFEEVRWAIAERLDGAVLVGHNLRFDQRMLDAEFDRSEGDWQPGDGVCTLRIAGGKLSAACSARGIAIEQEHRALSDARATASLFLATALGGPVSGVPARVSPAPRKMPRTLRREAFADRSQFANSRSISKWALAIDHTRFPLSELGYVDLLDRALDDLWISAEELVELSTLAQLAGIDPSRLPDLHRLYVEDLYAAATRDGVITDDEFRQLDAVSDTLGFRLGDLFPDFEELRPASVVVTEVEAGTRVAFTGAAVDLRTGRKIDRSALITICDAAGLIAEDKLTKANTQLLVAADPDSQSGKAKKARQWGIPVLSVADFISRYA